MKLTVVLTMLIGILVLACSTVTPVPAEPTPNIDATTVVEPTLDIDATVEARLAHERAVDATVEARLAEEKVSDAKPTSTPVPQATDASKPEPTDTTTLVPTATSVPTPTYKPTLAPTPVLWGGRYTMLVDQSPFGGFAGKTVRFKIGESYASETSVWEHGGFTSLDLTVASLTDGNVGGNASTSREVELRVPPHLFTGKGFFGGMHVPIGTVISAWVDGVKVSETNVVAEPQSPALGDTSEMFRSLGTNLRRVWIYLNYLDAWRLYVPGNDTLGINTYTDAKEGDIVWVLVNSNQMFQNGMLYEGWNLILLEQPITVIPAPSLRASFGDGTWVVGSGIKAGTYRSSQTGSSCYWQRLRGFSGEFDYIIVNELTEAISVVEISSTDAGFSTEGCGTWTEATSSITSSLSSPFGDGAYLVGLDIGPGTWTSPGGDSCYWERLSGFSGDFGDIEANGLGASNVVLTIQSTDAGFKSSNCGTWAKTG